MRPKITNTVTHTATMAMGKMKNWRTRKGVVWRGAAAGSASRGSVGVSVPSITRQYLRPGPRV
jgi:hypothetical protein